MGTPNHRFVGKAVKDRGWRIWNRLAKAWWGEFFSEYPAALLDELNHGKRPAKLVELNRKYRAVGDRRK